jgi:Starch-binding associating with outer membrane
MKILSNIIKSSLFLALLSSNACSKLTNFGDLNVSPNSPSQPNTASLFTNAMISVGGLATSDYGYWPIGSIYTQQFGDVTYIEESRYKTVNWGYTHLYTGPLNALNFIIKLNTDESTKVKAATNGSNANQIATARILKAFFFHNITDRWGDIPYSQALKGKDAFSPIFDTQQSIYTDLFKELKEAQAQLEDGVGVQGDILLHGDNAKWKKFANSLRLIMALRLSKVDAVKGKSEFIAALSDGVISSNEDNITFSFLNDANYASPLFKNYVTENRKDFAVSSTFIDYLEQTHDPRIAAFANKAESTLSYKGVPYGVFPRAWETEDISLASEKVSGENATVNVVTYAQILLSKAEAAKMGWIAEDAKALYEDALKESMHQWDVYTTDADFEAFISGSDVAYSDAKAIELIATQKWVTLFYQGYEAWAEWRRTGFPVLKPASKPLNTSGLIPRRMAYPTSEATLNKVNYDAVVKRQGADLQETRVWWDK